MIKLIIGSVAVLLTTSGCDQLEYEPDVGRLQAGEAPDASPGAADAPGDPDAAGTPDAAAASGPCADSDPSTVVSFSGTIRSLLSRTPACTNCHGTNATSGFNVTSYESLRRGGQVSGLRVIVAGKPCESIMFQKLGPAPPFGSRMPNSGPPYYSAADLALVRDWIAEGALNN